MPIGLREASILPLPRCHSNPFNIPTLFVVLPRTWLGCTKHKKKCSSQQLVVVPYQNTVRIKHQRHSQEYRHEKRVQQQSALPSDIRRTSVACRTTTRCSTTGRTRRRH